MPEHSSQLQWHECDRPQLPDPPCQVQPNPQNPLDPRTDRKMAMMPTLMPTLRPKLTEILAENLTMRVVPMGQVELPWQNLADPPTDMQWSGQYPSEWCSLRWQHIWQVRQVSRRWRSTFELCAWDRCGNEGTRKLEFALV